jgi:hypothetical protein
MGLVRCVLISLVIVTVGFAAPTDHQVYRKEREQAEKREREAEAASSKAREKAAEADRNVDAAMKQFEKVSAKMRSDFESSPDWTDAQAALKQAQSERDAAVQPILDKVHVDPAYKAALDRKNKASAEMEKVRAAGGSPGEIADAARKVTDAQQELNRQENEALKGNAVAQQSIAKLADANKHIGDLKKRLNDSLKTKPEIAAAMDSLQKARQDRDAANVALSEALEKQKQAHEDVETAIDRETGRKRKHHA